MASALIIGIGSTGYDVLERSLQYFYEFTKKEQPEHVAYMFLETARKSSEFIDKGILSFCDISTEGIQATLNGWHQEQKTDDKLWLPEHADILDAHDGAGGQPVYGRVALWANEVNVRAKIRQLYFQIDGNANTNIYIVGSLVGGTGSGVCLDIAYMVRETTKNNNIYGMFLLPNRDDVGVDALKMRYENAYTSIKSIDYYSKSDDNRNWYKCTMPSGTKIDYQGAPYKQIQFYTQDFSDASASMPQLPDLIQSVGFNLVLRVLDITNTTAPFQKVISDRIVDFNQDCSDGIFSTIGMNVFQYPEGLLEEYFATEQLKCSILDRWNDSINYISKSGSNKSIESLMTGELLPRVNVKMQEIIRRAIDLSRGTSVWGHGTLKIALEAEVDTILNKTYSSDARGEDGYVYDLFDAMNNSRFYGAIKGKSLDLRNAIVEGIAQFVSEISNEFQNLTVLKNVIDFISNSLNELTQLWRTKHNLDGTPDGWNKNWNEFLLPERLHNDKFLCTITGTQRQFYYESLNGVAQLCYYNVLFDVIEQIVNSLNSKPGTSPLTTPGPQSVTLPTSDTVNQISEKVKKMLDEKEPGSIMYRHDVIAGQLKNTQSSQFNFLYKLGSFELDVADAQGRYDNGGNKLSFKNITGVSMWDYLKDNSLTKLESSMIGGALEFIQTLKLFRDSDIVQIMKNLPNTNRKYPKVHSLLTATMEDLVKTLPAMCQLIATEKFVAHDKLKLIVASDTDVNNESGIVSAMSGYKPSPNGSNYVMLPSMKNTVVVYQEYSYLGTVNGTNKVFNPLIHLSYQSQVVDAITKKGSTFNSSKLRLAYLDEKQILDNSTVKIK